MNVGRRRLFGLLAVAPLAPVAAKAVPATAFDAWSLDRMPSGAVLQVSRTPWHAEPLPFMKDILAVLADDKTERVAILPKPMRLNFTVVDDIGDF